MSRLSWAVVLALFCAPLFVGLGRTDLKNDEEIYSFAVDVMLETGNWLTPASIPSETHAFLEKPPLKFWIVAVPIRLGLLPNDELGHRFWDAAFGGLAFLYVFAIGRRLGGIVCGFVAVFVLFVHWPLLFEHGLRSNTMEAPLFLSYCGGVYHTLAWSAAGRPLPRRLHPLAVAAFFVLGFMTKFAAALFLPLVLVAAGLLFPQWRQRAVQDWRAWAAALLLIAGATVPWFAYQTLQHGSAFWEVILGEHVVRRMTRFVDPSHVRPWHYYATELHAEMMQNNTAVLAGIGTALLALHTARRRWDAGTLVLLWFALPFLAISVSTSKLYHYLYPFLPPLALGAGYLPAALLARDSRVRRQFERAESRVASMWAARGLLVRSPRARRVAVCLAAVAWTVAVVTIVHGRFGIWIGDWLIFRNASIARPLGMAIVLLIAAGQWGLVWRGLLVTLALSVMQGPYRTTVDHLGDRAAPLQALRRCLLPRMPAGSSPGVYAHTEDLRVWRHIYYFRLLGWDDPPRGDHAALAERLFNPAEHRPVLIARKDYEQFRRALAAGRIAVPASFVANSDPLQGLPEIPSTQIGDGQLVLLPGEYGVCAESLIPHP